MKRVLIIKNEITEISKLVTFIETIGEELGLSPALVMSLNLALEEAVSNIILYAYPKEFNQDISIEAVKENNALIFTITDTGVEFDPTKGGDVDITLTVEDRPVGGLGIFLIKKIMNEVEYKRVDDMNVFTLKKLLE
ncbi:MAG: ATP-binding protein [Bacteroidales bacterium]|nr:ATP-binding protein [Bacteroidales bacterium]